MKSALKTLAVVIVVASIGAMVWPLTKRAIDNRARTNYFELGKAYAPRVLEDVGTLPPELRESSGLAVSRSQPGLLWSHNDSGDGPNLYAINQSGQLLATIRVANALAKDWEDIAAGPCPKTMATASMHCLFIADTGNNSRNREVLTIYVVVEPVLEPGKPAPASVDARSFSYRYPNQPDDAEALAVMPDGDVVIVTKGRSPTIDFFGLTAAMVATGMKSGEVLTVQYQGDTGIESEQRVGKWVTSAALSPDGMTLAVRTYSEIFFFAPERGPEGRRWRNLKRPCFLGDIEPQGEAIDYIDDKTMLLTSETNVGRPGKILRVQCS